MAEQVKDREELRELLIDAADAETSIGRRVAGLVVDAQLAALAESGVAIVPEKATQAMKQAAWDRFNERQQLKRDMDCVGADLADPDWETHYFDRMLAAGRIDKP